MILAQLGITETTLSPRERDALDREGYVVLHEVIDANWLERLRAAFERGCEKEGLASVVKESGTRHVNDLVNRDPVFEGVYTHPRLLAGAYHILHYCFGNFGSALTSRSCFVWRSLCAATNRIRSKASILPNSPLSTT